MIRMRPLIALALLLAACTSEPMDASLPAVPVADAGPPPPMPHGVRCVAPAGFRDIVIGTTTTATARCDVTGDAGELARIVDVAATRPFLATTTATIAASGATFTIEIAYTPTSSLTEDRSVVSVGFETIGQRELTTFEVRGQAVAPIDWAPAPAVPPCRADVDAPLLDRALAGTNLERSTFGFGATDLAESWYDSRALLSDEFVLSWFKPMRAQPHRSGCFEGEVAGALDAHMDSARPVTGAIRHAARWLDRVDDTPPFDPRALPGDHVAALDAICLAYRESCTASTGALPGDLARAIAPVFWAIHEGILARQQRDSDAAPRAPNWWVDHGGNGIIVSTGREGYDRTNPLDRAYLLGENRARLYRAAAQIAHAIESVDWSRFAGRTGVQYDLRTPAGWIRVRDASDDLYVESGDPVLLLIDLGGDDIHLDDVATNRTADNAVSIAIDLEGTDQYAYEAFATDQDRPGLVPADDGGRYAGDANFGTIALSGHFRQGAARNGIAMLFDLGEGDDHYQSLSGSQGYAHQGVGVLYDAGGNDTYLAESVSQGASQYGIGLLIDAGDGWDVRRSFTYSQGFGFVGAFGILADGGGDDIYVCDHGDPNRGGIRLFPSPQLPTSGNSSFCQGAGFGWRGDEETSSATCPAASACCAIATATTRTRRPCLRRAPATGKARVCCPTAAVRTPTTRTGMCKARPPTTLQEFLQTAARATTSSTPPAGRSPSTWVAATTSASAS